MTTPNIGELAATTIENYSGTLADNVTNHNPLLLEVYNSGNIMPVDGGTKIRQELIYAENGTSKWYSGWETLDVSHSEVADAADFDWKQFNVNVTISGLDEIKSSGKSAIHSLIKTRMMAAEKTAKNQVATALFSDGTGSAGKEIGGLQLLVADDPTSGTVGGIDRSAQTWFRNQTFDFSSNGLTGGNASSANINIGLNAAYLSCTRNGDKPNVIIMDDDYFTFYETYLQGIHRIASDKEADAGFVTLRYKGARVYFDDSCPDKHAYMLNTDFLHLRPSSTRNFNLDRKGIKPTNQDGTVFPMYWAGAFTTSNPSLQCVLKD